MLALADIVSARISDVAPGNLVAVRLGSEYVFSVAVRAPDHAMTGPLLLGSTENYPRVPAFIHSNDYCLDLRARPIMQWSGRPEALSNSFQAIPPVGHLVIVGACNLISGIIPGMVGFGAEPLYWDLLTGEFVPRFDYTSAIYVSEWNLGLRNVDGRYQVLVELKSRG